MKYFYKTSKGTLQADIICDKALILYTPNGKIKLAIEKDEDNDDFFIWQGEMIFVDEWQRIEIAPSEKIEKQHIFDRKLYEYIENTHGPTKH